MYFGEAVRVLIRRWYVLLAGLVLLVTAAWGIVAYVPTQYQATGQVLLVLPAKASGVATPTNPYLNLQAGLSTTASLVADSVSTKASQRELSDQGFKADYSTAVLPGAGPVIVVSTNSTNQLSALRTRDAVFDRITDQLKRLQSEVQVPDSQVISALALNVDKQAEVLPGNKVRALVSAGLLLTTMTLISAFVLDGWRRKRPRSSSRPAVADVEVEEPTAWTEPGTSSLGGTMDQLNGPRPDGTPDPAGQYVGAGDETGASPVRDASVTGRRLPVPFRTSRRTRTVRGSGDAGSSVRANRIRSAKGR